MRIMFLFAIAALFSIGFCDEPLYEFVGEHLIASYKECDRAALMDLEKIKSVMEKAVLASGATILETSFFTFPEKGFSMVILLSESHASIHTYPEHDACFVDIFTCGRNCRIQEFDRVLREYLRPKKITEKFLSRQ